MIIIFKFAVQHTFQAARKTVVIFWCNNEKRIGSLCEFAVFWVFTFWVVAVACKVKVVWVCKNNFHIFQTTPKIRSEEHTSELQSLMRISYAVFCLKKNTINHKSYAIAKQYNTLHTIQPQHTRSY